MIFVVVLGAAFYNGLLALMPLPQQTADWIAASAPSPCADLVLILVLYLLLGCLMDSLSMIILTIPIFWQSCLNWILVSFRWSNCSPPG